MFANYLENVRTKCPLIHNITNYVTVNDCANILLACGASPIMADDCSEVEEITTICTGLNINIGTLNKSTISAMLLAGKRANEICHPVLLDPVGAGASVLRTQTANKLLDEVHFTVIRGNISEIKTLFQGNATTKGVDADVSDTVTEETLDQVIMFAKQFAAKAGAVIAITGAIDIIADENKACVIRNGHPMMAKVTGTGCMLSAMMTAYLAANPDDIFGAVATSVCAMGICGEIAYDRMTSKDGNATYRNYIIDAVYNLNVNRFEDGAKYEMR
jgi:hydroxyethylthiazole kinase